MRSRSSRIVALLAALCAAVALQAAGLTRQQALDATEQADASARLAGVQRLGQIGQMGDAERLVPRLRDDDPRVRESAGDAMWRIWSRSGDPAIDRLFARGVEQMQAAAFSDALATFDDIVARVPAFAEGWNKRATIYFLMGENEKSLQDCDEVFKRNPNHFGALAGAGQIHLKLGNPERALEFFKRALKVNPNLESISQIVPLLEQHLRNRTPPRNTT
jgi:tetratricopeptide (TPR) repeat protein